MDYVEKHVTTNYGERRIDWTSAISLKMLNNLYDKIKILDKLNGSGSLSMNLGEKKYSVFGPMKKAAVLKSDMSKGSIMKLNDIKFIRTKKISDMSQIDVINSIGKKISNELKEGTVLLSKHFTETI